MSSSMKTEKSKSTTECKITCDFEILRHTPLFAGIDADVVKLFAYVAKHRKYKKDQQIITFGNEAAEVYYLLSGKARVTVHHGGKDCILQQLDARSFFGELALLARFKWFFNVHAEEESEAIIISRESFRKVLENFPQHSERLIEKIVQLRVERLIDQTSFLLDKMPDSLLGKGGPSI